MEKETKKTKSKKKVTTVEAVAPVTKKKKSAPVVPVAEPEVKKKKTASAVKKKKSSTESVEPAPVAAPSLPGVSVIIPMYNSARYILTCLTSVLNQTFKNFEVICVDDASTDNTVEIVKKFAARDGRIKVIRLSKNSGGASEPRNTGIKLSRGKYIAFLDADDMYTKTALEELYTLAEKWRADVVHTEQVYFPENKTIDVTPETKFTTFSKETGGFCKEPMLETDNLAKRVQMFYQGRFFGWVHNKLYRRDFLMGKNIYFDKLLTSEDIIFYFKVICTAPRIVRVPNIVYIYRNNPDSITRKMVTVEQSLHALTHLMVEGSKIMDDFMGGFDFFVKNPGYRQLPVDYIVQQHLIWTQKFYEKYTTAQLDEAVRNEIKKYCGEFTPFFAYLYNAIHTYRRKLTKHNEEVKELSAQNNAVSKMPLVSVVIPVYNAAKFIPQALGSLFYQTMQDFEVVVVDDGSTDNSVEVVENLAKKFNGRIRLIRLPENSGTPAAPRNRGIQAARGKYIAFLDADDLLTKTALEELTKLAEKSQADVVRLQNNVVLWGGKMRPVNAPGITDFAALTNPQNFTGQTYYKNRLTQPTLESPNVGERVKRWLSFTPNNFCAAWLQFCRRDFLIDNQIFFAKSEEVSFAFKAFCLAKNYLNAPNAVNIIRPLEGSFTRQRINRPEYFQEKVQTLNEGFGSFKAVMDKISFFKEHEDYRYGVLDWFANYVIQSTLIFYAQNPTFKLNGLIEDKFNDDTPLAAYLFNAVNQHRLQILKLQRELATLKK